MKATLTGNFYLEEYSSVTEQTATELVERVRKQVKPLNGIRSALMCDGNSSVRVGLAGRSLEKLSFSADFAAERAKTFIAAWRDGKWVSTENRSSKRKKAVGGKRRRR